MYLKNIYVNVNLNKNKDRNFYKVNQNNLNFKSLN